MGIYLDSYHSAQIQVECVGEGKVLEKGNVVPVQCLKETVLRLLTGDCNVDVGLDFKDSALMRTVMGELSIKHGL